MADVVENLLSKFQLIQISKIKSSQYQARKSFDDTSLKSLADSIHIEGLIEPIIVRQVGDEFELVSGERRLRACKLNGAETIEAKVIQTVSEAEAAAKGLVENLQREDLNPIEEAEGIQALLDLHDNHWTQEQIAKVIGKEESRISRTLRFISLSDQIKEKMRRRILTEGHAVELIRLPSPELQEQVGQKIEEGLSVMATRKLVDKLTKAKKAAETKTGRPSLDFFASVWSALVADTGIKACGYWGVEFKKDKWNFSIGAETVTSKADFATWFRQMADHIESDKQP